MADSGGNSFTDKLMLGFVVLIPVAAVVLYILNAEGLLQPASQTPAPVEQTTAQQTPAPQTASPAILSVDDPSALPTTVAVGDIIPFSFTIQNPGNADATYPYKVSVQWNDGENDVIDENVITLSAGASKSIPESLKFETVPATAKISIEISKPAQTITLMLPRTQ